MTEHDLQVACAEFLDRCLPDDAAWCHVPNEGKRSKAAGARLKREGLKPGWPDILIVYQGLLTCIELKAGKGRRSKAQIAMHDRLSLAGAVVVPECRSLDGMVEVLEQIIPLKGRVA